MPSFFFYFFCVCFHHCMAKWFFIVTSNSQTKLMDRQHFTMFPPIIPRTAQNYKLEIFQWLANLELAQQARVLWVLFALQDFSSSWARGRMYFHIPVLCVYKYECVLALVCMHIYLLYVLHIKSCKLETVSVVRKKKSKKKSGTKFVVESNHLQPCASTSGG